MTTIDTHAAAATGTAGSSAGRLLSGIAGWITTTDHKRIGRMYIVWGLLVAVVGAVSGALLAIQSTSDSFLDGDVKPQLESTYFFGLTFGALLPVILGVALSIVPLQVGARSVAFPRLAAGGFWAWAFGLDLMIIATAANGGGFGGTDKYVGLFLAGLLLGLIGLLATAGTLVTTILTTRAPGMNMRRVPLFTWSVLVTTVGLVVVLPVAIGTLLYSYLGIRYGNGFNTEQEIISWMRFAIRPPVAVLYALPVFGFALEVFATATGKRFPMRGMAFTGLGLLGITALTGVAQNSFGLRASFGDADRSDQLGDIIKFGLFNLLPLLGGLVVLGTGALALKAKPKLLGALPFALLGALLVYLGLVVNTAGLIADTELADLGFGEGAWLLVVYGAVLSVLGALAYWGGKLWGRSLPTKAVAPLALLGALGAAVAALPLVVTGFIDAKEADLLDTMATISAVGHAIVILTIVAFALLALRSFTRGPAADDNPYDGQTLEWAAASPAPHDNFSHAYVVQSAEPLLDLKPADHTRSGS